MLTNVSQPLQGEAGLLREGRLVASGHMAKKRQNQGGTQVLLDTKPFLLALTKPPMMCLSAWHTVGLIKCQAYPILWLILQPDLLAVP